MCVTKNFHEMCGDVMQAVFEGILANAYVYLIEYSEKKQNDSPKVTLCIHALQMHLQDKTDEADLFLF